MQDWIARYYQVKAQGLIVDKPQARLVGGLAEYPDNLKLDESLCSYRRTFCLAPTDIYTGPKGTWALNYDDG